MTGVVPKKQSNSLIVEIHHESQEKNNQCQVATKIFTTCCLSRSHSNYSDTANQIKLLETWLIVKCIVVNSKENVL